MTENTLIFVDCEGHGVAPTLNDAELFEFGAVNFTTRDTFHGYGGTLETFTKFDEWLKRCAGRPVFISDNPAYDWQFINYYFHKHLNYNPFGHSARRIGDFYGGVIRKLWGQSKWKQFRITPHDHDPVNDALGNVEAFETILGLIKT